MQLSLDKAIPSSRLRVRRSSIPALAIGLCALIGLVQQTAFGQAQVGSAETCFDDGPDWLPASPAAPVPPLRAEAPARIAAPLRLNPPRPSVTEVRRAHPQSAQDTPTGRVWTPHKKQPDGTLTAAR